MTVANQYLYQGWNCRLPGKYKDLFLDVGTEEMGHVEMIATMITRLLENAPLSLQEAAADNPMVGAIYGGSTRRTSSTAAAERCRRTATACPGTAASSPPAAT